MTSPVQLLYEEREIIMYWLIDEDQLGEELCLMTTTNDQELKDPLQEL